MSHVVTDRMQGVDCPDCERSTPHTHRPIQRFVCRDCGYGVKGDTDGCCAGCGKDCLVVELVYIPEDWGPEPASCGAILDEDGSCYECSRTEGHEGEHVDGDNGHTWTTT